MSTRKLEIKRKLFNKIKEEKNLSFPDIQDFFENEKYDYEGDHNLYTFDENGETNYSQIVWSGWNKETVDILCEIFKENQGKVALRCLSSTLEIFLSGGYIDLPIVKRYNHVYKEPHWLPCEVIYIK